MPARRRCRRRRNLRLLGLPAGWLSGIIIATALLALAGKAVAMHLVLLTGFMLIGCFIGESVRLITRKQLRAAFPDALITVAIGILVAACFAVVISGVLEVPFNSALLAFSPSALEAMIILSLVLGLDPVYVATHHLVRMLLIGFVLPVVMRPRPGGADQTGRAEDGCLSALPVP